MRHATRIITILLVVGFLNCRQPSQADGIGEKNSHAIESADTTRIVKRVPVNQFSRDSIQQRLRAKSNRNELRIIHVYVPLCDNEFQGIVPVNASLGDGTNLRTNLYWGAGYGIKTHFKRSSKWQTLGSTFNVSTNVLERVVFKHAGQNVILVADAYRGDQMESCVKDYFNTLAGLKTDTIAIGDSSIVIGSTTDLVVFNGHNGLMDVSIDTVYNIDGVLKDAVAIACVSHSYYVDYLNKSGGYPLVMTAHLLAPEAYVLDHVLDAWINNQPAEEIRFAAAQGYHKVQKCGIRGASNLFVTGWGN